MGMVDVMEGVDDLPSPNISTVLVDQRTGNVLKAHLGIRVALRKQDADGIDVRRPINTSVSFRCATDWQNRRDQCQRGDSVDVRLMILDQVDAKSRWPHS